MSEGTTATNHRHSATERQHVSAYAAGEKLTIVWNAKTIGVNCGRFQGRRRTIGNSLDFDNPVSIVMFAMQDYLVFHFASHGAVDLRTDALDLT